MKNEDAIRKKIEQITTDYKHVLDCYPATVFINAPRCLSQFKATTELEILYWILGEERPQFKCDDFTKTDHIQ